MRSSPRPPSRLVLVLLGAVALLHASRYTDFFTDAGFLALLRAQGLVGGAPSIGDSGLLWVVALAGLELTGVPGVDGARFLGALGLVLCVALTARESPWPAVWLVVSGALASSAMGGSSLPLLAAAGVAAARELEEEGGTWLAVVLAGLRLDGIVLVLGLAAGAGSIRFASAGVLAFLVHLALAYSALSPTLVDPMAAATSWGAGLLWHAPLLAVGVAALVRSRHPEPTPALGAAAAWLLWIGASGQGSTEGFIAWAPVVPLVAMGTVRVPTPLHALAGAFALHLLASPMQEARSSLGIEAVPVAEALRRGFAGEPPVLATAQPGALPYLTGFTSRSLDADDAELVAFCGPLGAVEPCTDAGRARTTAADWERFRPVVVEADGRRGHYWLRTDGRFAPTARGEGLELSALVLSSDSHPARAGADGFYLQLAEGDVVTVELDLPRGLWRPATQGFRGPTMLHNGGPLKLTATALEDRVASSLTWISEPR